MSQISVYLPSLSQLTGLGAVLVVVALLIGLGAAVGGRHRAAESDVLSGWAVLVLAYTAAGVLTGISFSAVLYGFVAVAVGAGYRAWRRDGRLTTPAAAKMLLLAVPFLIVVSAMMASQWDEFSQWLWSGRYLLELDTFPRDDLPRNLASFPSYPYGLPLIMYTASRIAGFFVENAGALFHLCLMLAFALVVVRLIALATGRDAEAAPSLNLCALGIVATMIFPPFIVQKIMYTAYADTGTAVAVGFAGVLGWLAVNAAAEGDRARARTLAWQAGLALLVLVNLKQANLVLMVLALVGVGLAGLRTPGLRLPPLAALLGLMAAPGALIYALWRLHLSINLTGREFTIRPFADWNIDFIPEILHSMWRLAANKGGFFLLLVVIALLSLRALVRYRHRFDGLAIVAGCLVVGYNGFLFFAYVASFGGDEARFAASYWRYNMHLGPTVAAITVYGGALLWQRYVAGRFRPRRIGWLGVALAIALPIGFAYKIRVDIRAPKIFVRQVGAEMATFLPGDAKLIVVDPLDSGFYNKLITYELYRTGEVVAPYLIFYLSTPLDEWLRDRGNPDYAFVHTQNDVVRETFGLPLPQGAAYLLHRDGTAWEVVKSWPYPGYNLPTDIKD